MVIIQITQREADYIISHLDCNKRNLKKSSSRKKHGGKTYYVMNDDVNSLRLLAKLRGYEIPENMNKYSYSPIKALLSDN